MANGFFLGGAAEGIMGAQKQALAERTQTEDTALRSRGLDLQERQFSRQVSQDAITRGDAEVANTMTVVGEIIKGAVEAGRDPAAIQRAVKPLVDSAKAVAARVGKNPNALDAQVQAQLFRPTTIEGAAVKGAATAAQEIAETRALNAATGTPGTEGLGNRIKDPKAKAEVENTLRDDYGKQIKDFITVRDFKDRMDTAPATGAGDLALVFSYMKMLDPASTVREGEQASASNAAGVSESIRALYNKALGGGNLTDTARTQLRGAANEIFQKALARKDNITNNFAGMAKRKGLDPNNVIFDVPLTNIQTTPGGTKFRVLN